MEQQTEQKPEALRYFIYSAAGHISTGTMNRQYGRSQATFPTNRQLKEFVHKEESGKVTGITILAISEVSETDYKTYWSDQGFNPQTS